MAADCVRSILHKFRQIISIGEATWEVGKFRPYTVRIIVDDHRIGQFHDYQLLHFFRPVTFMIFMKSPVGKSLLW
ncbi:Uncharacterised protein [Bacteroides xylanisolvens]|nr:Uncharacterised protein [Bacteroides xylanisolvens]